MDPPPDYKPLYPGAGRLKGKVALITGGDSGIGRAVAVLFAREGADVAIAYLSEDTDAQHTKSLIEAEGVRAVTIKGDVRDASFGRAAVEEATEILGHINILVNNAAVQYPQNSLTAITTQQLHETFETNIYSYFYFTQTVLEYMKAGDVIINTTSVTAYRGSHHLVDYSATKGAIVAFTRSLALQLAPKGIRVNAVAPGPIWTPLIPASFDAEEVATFGTDVPLGRAGQPAEVAPSYLFLASGDSSYMTGQVLHPNGGEMVES